MFKKIWDLIVSMFTTSFKVAKQADEASKMGTVEKEEDRIVITKDTKFSWLSYFRNEYTTKVEDSKVLKELEAAGERFGFRNTMANLVISVSFLAMVFGPVTLLQFGMIWIGGVLVRGLSGLMFEYDFAKQTATLA